MGRYRRLMHMAACLVAVFASAAAACASGVSAGPTVTVEIARAAVLEAERAVRRAEEQYMLWTTADDAMRGARRAFEAGNLPAAVEQARVAKEHAELAIAQKRYPPYRF